MRHFRHNLMDLRHLMVTFIFKGHFGLIKADKKMHTYKKKKKIQEYHWLVVNIEEGRVVLV